MEDMWKEPGHEAGLRRTARELRVRVRGDSGRAAGAAAFARPGAARGYGMFGGRFPRHDGAYDDGEEIS